MGYIEIHWTRDEVGFHAPFGHFEDNSFVGDNFVFERVRRITRNISCEIQKLFLLDFPVFVV
jgi:hypothetical protein